MTTPAVRSFATIVREGEWPLAAVLAESLQAHHPGSMLHVLAVDRSKAAEPADGVHSYEPEAIELSPETSVMLLLAASASGRRIATAPAFVAHLLANECPGGVLYLAPDTMVVAPLPPMPATGIGLLPRFLTAPVEDGRTPTADEMIAMSIFDDGFLWAAPDAADALVGASERIGVATIAADGMIERAWDLLAASTPTTSIDDPSLGVAYWNASERHGPITTIRMPGLDPATPHLLSVDQGMHPRVLLSERAELRALAEEHVNALQRHGMRAAPADPRVGGVTIDASVQAAFREALRTGDIEPDGLVNLASDPTGQALADWLAAPFPGGRDPRVSRYLMGVWSGNKHASGAFPYPTDMHADQFIEWTREARGMSSIPARFMPRTRETENPTTNEAPAAMEKGVNLIGFLRAGFGQGEASRLMHEAMIEGGIPHVAISLTHEGLDDQVESAADGQALRYDINLSCVNVDALEVLSRRLGIDLMEERYSIGTIWWESNLLPSYLIGQMNNYLDEVWVGSTYIAEALVAYTDRPIRVFPLPVRVPEEIPTVADRAAAGLPEGYLFMFSFDFNSTVERKNPDGVIEAFRRAFPEPSGAHLMLKTINGDRHLQELERLRAETADRDDITIFDGFLPVEQRDAWAAATDCYVSLHRSEGFGLTMAEAMAMGKPVIATAYSANLDFMNDYVAFMVPGTDWRLPAQAGPYPAGSLWADPDLDVAARYMREAAADPGAAAAMGLRARRHIAETRTMGRLADFMVSRIDEIRAENPTLRPRPNSRLTMKLNDALAYDRQRHDARHGLVSRVLRKLMRPYSAGADELDRRMLAAMVELGGRLDEVQRQVDAVEQDVLEIDERSP
jgi:glycosyltransferase involved in cell wall biosynthesis